MNQVTLQTTGESQEVPHETQDVFTWRPVLLSFLLHVLLVVILCLSIRSSSIGGKEPERPVGIVLTDTSRVDESIYLDETDVQEDEQEVAVSVEQSPSSTEAPEISMPASSSDSSSPIALPGVELDVSRMTQVPGRVHKPRKLTQAELDQIAADQASFAAQQPKGPPATISVFGSGKMSGQSFVFLLDRSASMGSGGLGVLQASRTELGDAIANLEEYHRFQVVGYHNQAVPIFGHRLLNADEQNKKSVPAFISRLAAFGSTDHLMALLTALAYQPDVVVLMTDGGLPELNAGHLKRIKKAARGAQIHCIQFGRGPGPKSTNFMRLLAVQNQGSYQYVDVNQWDADE